MESCEVIDFDHALFDACGPDVRADLLTEAQLLAGVFTTATPEGYLELAAQLSTGSKDREMSRARARLLGAALKRLARA